MNERFKFRVWDVQEQKYLYFDLSNKGSISDFEYFATEEAPDYNEQIKCPDSNCWALIIEQCTGLKDKNGKLIYEGDIVKTEWFDEKNIYQVVWDEKMGCFCFENADVTEVIGNVHENPDLLGSDE